MISAQDVKDLRERTGAGMMDCKKALTEADGDMEKAIDLLREKGLAAAAKKAGRIAAEGIVEAYIHGGGRIGVIVEAETDVVNDAIKEAMTNVAMQIAALSPKYVSTDDVSEEYKAHEKEILMAQIANDPKMAGKPEKVIEGAVVGRLNKELKEVCLLEQPYVKAEDGKQTVAQYLAQVAKENGAKLSVKKFVRFETGEGLEKKVDDFAAEVAAQAGM